MKSILLHAMLLGVLLFGVDFQAPQRPPALEQAGNASIYSRSHPIRVAQLVPGFRIEVDLLGRGCFDLFQAHLQLTGDRSARIRLAGSLAREGHALKVMTPRYLTHAEEVGLDRVLDLYRTREHEGTCTSQTDIRLTLYDGQVVSAIEQYHDASCSNDGLAGLVYFESLAVVAFEDVVVP